MPPRHKTPWPQGLNPGMYNILYVQGFGLSQAIWEVQISNYDMMIMTETKISNDVHCHNRIVYDVVCSPEVATAVGGAKDEVVMVVYDRPKL